MNYKLESRLLGEISKNMYIWFETLYIWLYIYTITLMVESEEKLKSLLMKVKDESEKIWLKTQHSKN